ncbi:TetR/AcrR family transcriptional regulator [Leifsonia sp. NPDC058194]|uniref:TetR/AcrR family transcriptional regulator n=1 Tax=Leifsonia sp. NPDC058194 TaxID=3346374 RepID=UPI0036DBA561
MPRTIDRDARRAELAEAVWRVIVERGIGAVSVRTVAAEAGVAVGSLRHLFPTRTELLEFSAGLMVDRATRRIAALPGGGEATEHALDVLRQLLPLSPDSRAELEVTIALIAETPALPGLSRIRDEADRALTGVCRQLVDDLAGDTSSASRAQPERQQDALRLHALVDGLAMHLLVRGGDPGWALDVLRAEIGRLAG